MKRGKKWTFEDVLSFFIGAIAFCTYVRIIAETLVSGIISFVFYAFSFKATHRMLFAVISILILTWLIAAFLVCVFSKKPINCKVFLIDVKSRLTNIKACCIAKFVNFTQTISLAIAFKHLFDLTSKETERIQAKKILSITERNVSICLNKTILRFKKNQDGLLRQTISQKRFFNPKETCTSLA